MLPTAKEEMLSQLAPSSEWIEENIFSFAVGVALAALGTHRGAHAAQSKKPHKGFCSTNPALRIGEIWAKWSRTHQDSETRWRKTASGSALDANGNTLSDTQGRSFTWDFESRLTQVVVPGANGGTTTFKYDPFGRRIQKSGPLGTTNFLYDGDNLLGEVDNSGNVLARYAQGAGIDEPISALRGSTTSYYQADEALGSITSLSNGAGALTNTYAYDSFGNLTASTGTLTNPFRYTGREFDSETGLYFYRARYLDSSTGRFISEDPVRFEGGMDFYAYVDNAPINEYDPFGWAGGPKKPKGKMRCRDGGFDSCKTLQWKIALFEKAIYSHLGWDWYMPWPRGGGRHDNETAELFDGLANCIRIYEKRCKNKDCAKAEGFPDPVPQLNSQPNTPTTRMPVPIDPIIPPMPMPEPGPIEIPFEPIFAPI